MTMHAFTFFSLVDHAWDHTFVYGFSHHYLQKTLWEQIGIINEKHLNPLIIIGDLNEISSPDGSCPRGKVIPLVILILIISLMLINLSIWFLR